MAFETEESGSLHNVKALAAVSIIADIFFNVCKNNPSIYYKIFGIISCLMDKFNNS